MYSTTESPFSYIKQPLRPIAGILVEQTDDVAFLGGFGKILGGLAKTAIKGVTGIDLGSKSDNSAAGANVTVDNSAIAGAISASNSQFAQLLQQQQLAQQTKDAEDRRRRDEEDRQRKLAEEQKAKDDKEKQKKIFLFGGIGAGVLTLIVVLALVLGPGKRRK